MKDKFLHINSTALAEEQEFISWVKHGTNDRPWNEWLNKHPESKKNVDEARMLVNMFQFSDSGSTIDKKKLWDRIENSTEAKTVDLGEGYKKVKRLYKISFGAIAASLILLFAIMPMLRENTIVSVDAAESIAHILPDNSQIYINAGSELKYYKKGWEDNRKLELEGEAFFEVEKGSTFTVLTNNGSVEVLGTKFNVFSRGEIFKVKCTEGRVKVTNKNKRTSQVLEAGDVVFLNKEDEFDHKPFQAKFDWRNSAYSYNIVALRDVFAEIERQFDVEIIASPQIMSMHFTGPLQTKRLEKALYMISYPMHLNYEIDGTKIRIEEK